MTTFDALIAQCELNSMRVGLERIGAIDCALGSPSKRLRVVHVAGTNGKGSVATKVAAVLQANGLKVGLFTSPHLASYTERIQIDGEPIAQRWAEGKGEVIAPFEPSFFEAVTALGFLAFAEAEVDVAVVEVGMGGRLDATNIVNPVLSVITSIGFDHMRYLGNSLEGIAFEKAGIIKPGVPAVVGPRAVPFAVFEAEAKRCGSPLVRVADVRGHFEEENRAVARRALEVLPFRIETWEGLERVPPGRFERFGSVVVDVAHNPPALEALFERLEGPHVALVAFSADKDVGEALAFLQERAVALYLTEAKHVRAARVSALSVHAPDAHVFPDLEEAFEAAHAHAEAQRVGLVVCGTFFIMEWIRKRLGAR